MGKKIFLFLWIAAFLVLPAHAAGKKFTLVIDAGHGGHDAGARGKFSKEKNINLNVALAFGRYVERNSPDVKVVYTRKTDIFVPLHERANIANRNKADLFISIHTNALPGGKTARGLETYTLGMHRASDNFDVAKRENSVILYEKDYEQHYEGFDPRSSESYIMFEFLQDKNMAQSVELAKFVQKRVCAVARRPNKGVKQAGFLVLRETSMPSCLIELGFITTADEERFLNTSEGTDALGRGIYDAFMDYKRKYDKNITVPYQAEKKREINIPTVVPEEERKAEKPKKKADTSKTIAKELASARMMETEAPKENSPERTDTVVTKASIEPAKPEPEAATQAEADTLQPVFKIQILASSRNLRPDSQQFKGLKDVESYEENGMYKYTYGASADYNEIYRLRKKIAGTFPGAFIIAFKDGVKTDVQAAIREFKQNRNNK